MCGFGVYVRDTYMKAPIFIGTDICVLVVLVPMLLHAIIMGKKHESDVHKLRMMSMFGTSLFMTFYYAIQIKTK